jgi:energy-converting hydrogenase Eha subunit H
MTNIMGLSEPSAAAQSIAKSILSILVALGLVGVIIYFLPLLDIVYYFAMIVLIPIVVLIAMGVISKDSYNIVVQFYPELRKRVIQYRKQNNKLR